MNSTYSVTDAQAQLPALLKHAENNLVAITRRQKTVAYLLSAARMEAIAETLEIMADPKAMAAIRKAKTGAGKYYPLTALDAPDEG
jgi:PHD/YefM family antitoxin component YafN of YafNO toxin-antitoxin module